MKIHEFSDQLELIKWKFFFRIFSRAEMRILRYFRSKIDGFQIDQYMLVCQNIEKISKLSLFSRIAVPGALNT